jgi:MFS transporter, DHA1 family, tetracycline resistance protein
MKNKGSLEFGLYEVFVKKIVPLCLVLFIVFLDWIGLGLVYPIFSTMLFHSESGMLDPSVSESTRNWYLGSLLAVMSITQFFSSPILGSFSDQKGRRPLYLFSLIIGTIGYAICIYAIHLKSIYLLIFSRCFVGICAGNAAVVTATIADLSDSTNKTKHFGLYSMASGFGFALGPFLGGVLAKSSFTLPFYVAGTAIFLSFWLIFFFFKETYLNRTVTKIKWSKSVSNLKKAFKIQELKVLFLMLFLFCFGWCFFYDFIPVTWIVSFKLTSDKIGEFYAYGAVLYALSAGVLIRPIVNRYKHHSVLFYALFFVGLITMGSSLLDRSYWIWIYLPILNFLAALIFPTSMGLISDKANKDSQGEVLGILQSVQASAFAIAPIVAGVLLGDGKYAPMVIGGFSMLLSSIVLGRFLRKEIFTK